MPCGSGPWPVLALATRTLVSGPWPRRALVAGRWSLWLWRWCGKPPRTIRALHNSAQLPVSSAKQRDELAAAHSIALDASSVAPSRCCTSPSTDSAQAYGRVTEQFRHPQPATEFGQTNASDKPHLAADRQPSVAQKGRRRHSGGRLRGETRAGYLDAPGDFSHLLHTALGEPHSMGASRIGCHAARLVDRQACGL